MTSVSIILPTYNERDNVGDLVSSLAKTLEGLDYEIIVVDDSSFDGTAAVALELSETYPVRTILRRKRGLASAIMTGFGVANGEVIGVLDADGQHPPENALAFIDEINDGYDIVLGSRYIDGGSTDGWTKRRVLMSKGAVLLAKPLVTGVTDPMSGYFFIRKSVIKDVKLNPRGFKLGLEILVKGKWDRLKEIPIKFEMRKSGTSKISMREVIRFVRLLVDLYIVKLAGVLKG